MDLLVLCTGNICRSPMAEALLAAESDRRAVGAAVGSAGFVTEDRPAEPHAVQAMAERGLDLTGHRSRMVTPELLAEADLVLAMTREHVRRAAGGDREVFRRTFTLKELVARGRACGPVGDRPVADWLEILGENRAPTDLLGHDDRDDIADPMGRSLRRFRACADEIEAAATDLAELLWDGGDGRRETSGV